MAREAKNARARGIINIVGGCLLLCVVLFLVVPGAADLSSHGGGNDAAIIVVFGLFIAGLGVYRLVAGLRSLRAARPEAIALTSPSVTSGQGLIPPASASEVPLGPMTAPASSVGNVQNAMITKAKKRIRTGAIWLGVGLLLTVITYSLASSSPSGGVYVVAWGPMLVGAVQIIRGLISLYKYRN